MRPKTGFTLVETLIVITMVGLVTAIALPRINATRQRMQLDGAAQQVVGDLRRAKIEALKRNGPVTVWRLGQTTYLVQYVGERALEGGVTFSAGPDSVRFASFGPSLTGPASFTLALGSLNKTVALSAAGMPSVQ